MAPIPPTTKVVGFLGAMLVNRKTDIEASPKCVQCGYCCTVSACYLGEWDDKKEQCKFLTQENKCGKYKEIIDSFGYEGSPGFGTGCSSSLFNERREAVLRKNISLDA